MTHWVFKKYNNKDRFQIRTNNTVCVHIFDEHFKLPVSRGTGLLCRCYCLVNLQRRNNLWDEKHTKGNKDYQTEVVFYLSTCNWRESRKKVPAMSSWTDTIHIKKAKGLLQLILLYSIRKHIFSPLSIFTCTPKQYPDCQSQYLKL